MNWSTQRIVCLALIGFLVLIGTTFSSHAEELGFHLPIDISERALSNWIPMGDRQEVKATSERGQSGVAMKVEFGRTDSGWALVQNWIGAEERTGIDRITFWYKGNGTNTNAAIHLLTSDGGVFIKSLSLRNPFWTKQELTFDEFVRRDKGQLTASTIQGIQFVSEGSTAKKAIWIEALQFESSPEQASFVQTRMLMARVKEMAGRFEYFGIKGLDENIITQLQQETQSALDESKGLDERISINKRAEAHLVELERVLELERTATLMNNKLRRYNVLLAAGLLDGVTENEVSSLRMQLDALRDGVLSDEPSKIQQELDAVAARIDEIDGRIQFAQFTFDRYRGVNFGWWFSPHVYQDVDLHHDEQDFARLAWWGGNLIRLPIRYWMFELDSAPYKYREEGFDQVTQALDWAHKYGLKVMLDMHAAPGGANQNAWSGSRTGTAGLFENKGNEDRFIALWVELVKRYKDHPAIAFWEILNEPNLLEDFDRWNNLAKKVTAIIRELDPHTPILVNSNQGAAPVAFNYLEPTGDDNTYYAYHGYNPSDYSHGAGAFYPGDFAGQYWDRGTTESDLTPVFNFAKRHSVPLERIILGEFGTNMQLELSDNNYVRDMISTAEKYGFSWAFWNYRDTSHSGMAIANSLEESDVHKLAMDGVYWERLDMVQDFFYYNYFTPENWLVVENTRSVTGRPTIINIVNSLGAGVAGVDVYVNNELVGQTDESGELAYEFSDPDRYSIYPEKVGYVGAPMNLYIYDPQDALQRRLMTRQEILSR